MRNYKKIAMLCVLSILVLLPSLASATSIAKVIAVSTGATVEHNGTTKDLALKDDLFVKDVIRTNSEGKVQLMFNDDSIVTVGVNSTFIMEDYNDTGTKSFKGNLSVGFARFVTGNIVVENPEGFSVRTPEATVGIRGTTLGISTLNGRTNVATENTLNDQSVIVGNTSIPPGQIAGFGLNGVVLSAPAPMTDTQRNDIVEQSTIGQTVPEGEQSSIVPSTLGDPSFNPNDANSLQSSLNDQNTLAEGLNSANATVSGSLTENSASAFSGTFSFKANLLEGSISDGRMDYNYNGDIFAGTGGVGSFDEDEFELEGTGTLTVGGPSAPTITTHDWDMDGNTGIIPGQSVNGEWEVENGSSGSFTGTVSQ